jgi:predicted permease
MPDRSTFRHTRGQGEWGDHLRTRLAPLRLSPEREAEIVDELSQHLDDRYAELRADGSDDGEARRLALEDLQDEDTLARYMQPLRQAHMPVPIAPGEARRGWTGQIWQDVRYAARLLRKQPGFTAAAVVTLALGIGANTALFSLVNATLFQRLPVADGERLVYANRGTGGVFAYPLYASLRDHNRVLDGFAGWGGIVASLNTGDSAELVSGFIVTGNFFDVLGVRAAHGRLLSPADDVTPGAHPVAVVSYDFWQTRFAGRPDVVGTNIRLNGHAFTIVGVAPPGFSGPRLGVSRNVYVPMMMQAIMRPPRARYSGEQDPDLLRHPTNSWISGAGRLKAGVTLDQARADLDAIAAEYSQTRLTTRPQVPFRVTLLPFEENNIEQGQELRLVALLLGGVVGAVLLIACANIANLLLSRAAARQRELALRLALGASRARLVRQLLTESVLLSLAGGVVGMALAWGIAQAFRTAQPPPGALPLAVDFSIDYRVLIFAFALSGFTGILFGIAPAFRASRPELVPALKDVETGGGERRARFDLKRVLVVAEVALSLLLLIVAGLFVRSLQAARAIDPGIDVERLASARLNINLLRYTSDQGREFYRQAVERVERLPGVESATVARVAVFGGNSRVLSLHVEGRPATHDRMQSEGGNAVTGDRRVVNANVVGPRFFPTLGVRLIAGRDFADTDVTTAPRVAILNETAARIHFPNANPSESRISVDGPNGPWRSIVGVVRDSAYSGLADGGVPVVYLPLTQNHETGMTLYVRASVPPASLAAGIRREIQALEPNLPVPSIQTMPETIGTSLYPARMGAWLIGVFGGLALLLAAVGIYGVLSFSISRRTREMGIRMALGADRSGVFLLVLRDGLWLVGIGIVLGVAGGVAAARLVATLLYGIPATDPIAFGGPIAMLSAVALVACALPAGRALRIDPIGALRHE